MTFLILILGVLCTAGVCLADWNVVDFGAVSDGQTDCTAAFQQALDVAEKAGGGTVRVPAGRWYFRGTLSIPAFVRLQGVTTGQAPQDRGTGTILLVTAGRGDAKSAPFLQLNGHNAAVGGLQFVYPDWKITDVPPVPYPPTIANGPYLFNVVIEDCNLQNAYEGIRLIGAHRHLVRNVHGYPAWRGLYIDNCLDIGRIENCHFWPYSCVDVMETPEGKRYWQWVNLNGVAYEFARSDWQSVLNTFCFGYGVGYKFSNSGKGTTNGSFLGIAADSCEVAVLVADAHPAGLLITNGEFVGGWESQKSVTLKILPSSGGKISLSNCAFWGPIDRCIEMSASMAQLSVIGCHFYSWDIGRKRSPAIWLGAGRSIVQANTFSSDGEVHVQVGEMVRSAIVAMNQADGRFRLIAHPDASVTQSMNGDAPVPLSASQRMRFRLNIGSSGDLAYLKGWHDQERGNTGGAPSTWRWAKAGATVRVPVNPNRRYTVRARLRVDAPALMPGAGLYVGNTRIAPITRAGVQVISGVIPAGKASELDLTWRVKPWVPAKTLPGSIDVRELGVYVDWVELASGTTKTVTSLNTGRVIPAQ